GFFWGSPSPRSGGRGLPVVAPPLLPQRRGRSRKNPKGPERFRTHPRPSGPSGPSDPPEPTRTHPNSPEPTSTKPPEPQRGPEPTEPTRNTRTVPNPPEPTRTDPNRTRTSLKPTRTGSELTRTGSRTGSEPAQKRPEAEPEGAEGSQPWPPPTEPAMGEAARAKDPFNYGENGG
ncbi:proteoglycan 4-like, partial [Myiozetetes cayanensis]|uniref:proteoglycan 4-like n=1 Tax=Myiozetetes cayanensis TaxID=478635 RepID=UPI002160B912